MSKRLVASIVITNAKQSCCFFIVNTAKAVFRTLTSAVWTGLNFYFLYNTHLTPAYSLVQTHWATAHHIASHWTYGISRWVRESCFGLWCTDDKTTSSVYVSRFGRYNDIFCDPIYAGQTFIQLIYSGSRTALWPYSILCIWFCTNLMRWFGLSGI